MKRRSIEQRLTVQTAVGAVVLLALFSAVVYLGVQAALVETIDHALYEEARLIAGFVEEDEDGFEFDFHDLDREGLPRGGGPSFLQLRLSDGEVIYRSHDFGEQDLPWSAQSPEEAVYEWVDHPTAGRLRTVQLAFDPLRDFDESSVAEVSRVALTLARPDDPVAVVLQRLAALLGISGLLLGVGASAMALTLTRNGLRPLRAFAARIESLDARQLSRRLDTETAPTEVAPVGERLNEFLDRLEDSFQRERAFSADIAHELRTPLTGIRATVDVALRQSRNASAYRLSLEEVQEAASRLQSLVDRLLWLVRLDAESVELEVQPVDIAVLLEQTWSGLEAGASERALHVEWKVPEGIEVVSDPLLARIALRNVLENAVAYTNEGGEVSVRVEQRGDRTVIEVSNTGSQIAQEDVPRLLRRFVRGDEARTFVGAKCGLGLALVDKIAEALGHALDVQSRPGGRFGVSMSLPAAARN